MIEYGSEVIALAAKKLAMKARLPPADPMVATRTISATVTGRTAVSRWLKTEV